MASPSSKSKAVLPLYSVRYSHEKRHPRANSPILDTTVGSAYACCVAAITFNAPNAQPDTSIFAFQPGSTGPANCFIGQTSDTCPNPASNPSTAITGAGGSLVLGNSYCGEINAAVAVLVPSSSAVAKRTEATGAV